MGINVLGLGYNSPASPLCSGLNFLVIYWRIKCLLLLPFPYYLCSLFGHLRSEDPNSGAHRSSSKNNLRWLQRRRKPPLAPPATPLSLALSPTALHPAGRPKKPIHKLKTSPPRAAFMEIRSKTAKPPKLNKPNLRSSQRQHYSSRP